MTVDNGYAQGFSIGDAPGLKIGSQNKPEDRWNAYGSGTREWTCSIREMAVLAYLELSWTAKAHNTARGVVARCAALLAIRPRCICSVIYCVIPFPVKGIVH